MSKGVDVDLRIRAKNLAGKTLDELNAQVVELTKNQKEQASSSELASRSMKDLVAQQQLLAATTRELSRREGLTKTFIDQRKEIGATAAKIKELSAAYRQMQKGGGGTIIGFKDSDTKKVGAEIVALERNFERLIKKNRETGETLRALGVDTNKAGRALQELGGAVVRSSNAYDGAVAAVAQHTGAVQRDVLATTEAARRNVEQAAAQQRVDASIRESIGAYNRRAQAIRDATAAFGPEFGAQQRSNEIRNRLVGLLNTERGQRILTAEATRRQTNELNTNTGAHARHDTAVRRGATGIGLFDDVGRKSLGTYQRLRGQLLGLAAAYIGIYQAINTFRSAIDATTRNQALQVGLLTVNAGNAKAAAADYQFLRAESERLGLVFDDLAPKYANMAISGKALGLSTGQVRDVFRDVATSVAAGNLSLEDSEGVFRAIVQIMSKGKVQAEELRGQLGDRLPGAVALFAKANNIALTDLDKMLKDGTVGIDFLIKGVSAYAGQFAGQMDSVETRLQATINRAKNAYNDFLRSLLASGNAEKLGQAFNKITEFFNSREGSEFAKSLVEGIGKAIQIFIGLANNVDKVILVFKAFIALQILKGVIDLGAGVVATSASFLAWSVNVNRASVALAAGRTATTGMTIAARGLSIALGPVGLIFAAVGAASIAMANNFSKAEAATDDLIFKLKGLSRARGADAAQAAVDAGKEAGRISKELLATRDQLAKAKNGNFAQRLFEPITRADDLVMGRANSVQTLTEKVKQLTQEAKLATATTNRLLAEDAKFKNAPKEPDGVLAPLGGDKAAKEKKGPKGPSAESLAKKEMSEENSRANAARAIQKELLDLDQELFDARIDGELRTVAQIDKNYELEIRKIESRFAEAQLSLDRLAQNAQTAAGTGNAISAEDQAGLAIAREKLDLLKLALNARAMEKSEIAEIQIQEKAINDLIATRDAKIAYINTLRETGAITDQKAYADTIAAQDHYNAQISTLATNLIAFLQQIDPNSDLYTKLGVDRLILGLQRAQAETAKLTTLQTLGQKFGPQLAAGFSNAFAVFARGVAGAIQGTNTLGDAFSGAMDAFREFAANFLVSIAEMIIQALILYAIQVLTGTAPQGGFSLASVFAPKQHKGGVVGKDRSGTARVSPMVFAGAQRFHSGGLPGLKPNEVPTILEKGEEVLPANSPRHIGNQGGTSEPNVTVINTIDSASVVKEGYAGARGTILNDVQANRNSWKKALGIP